MPAGFSGRRRILERTPRAEPRLSRFPSAREAPDCSRSGRLVSCVLDSRCGGRTCLRERDRSVLGVVPPTCGNYHPSSASLDYVEAAPRKRGNHEQPNGLVNRGHRMGKKRKEIFCLKTLQENIKN